MKWGFQSAQNAQQKDGFLPTTKLSAERFIALQNQLSAQSDSLVDQQDLINKHKQVITSQKARIAILEEQLRLNKAQRFGPSSETDPVQPDFFIDPNAVDEMSDSPNKDDDGKKEKETRQPQNRTQPCYPSRAATCVPE